MKPMIDAIIIQTFSARIEKFVWSWHHTSALWGKKIEPLPQNKIGVNPIPCLFIKCISTEFQKPPETIFEYLFSIGKQSSVLSWQYSRSVDSVSP